MAGGRILLLAAVFTWGLGVFGASVYLHEVTRARGWSVSLVSAGITVFYLTVALVLPAVGAAIDRRGSRPVIAGGAVLLALGVAAMGHVAAPGSSMPRSSAWGSAMPRCR